MKKNFTLIIKRFSILTLSHATFFSAYSQSTAPSMVFHNAMLGSGTNGTKNAKYKFVSVTPGVDANLTIVDLGEQH